MIVPVKCPGCGKVLANIYRAYLDEVRLRKTNRGMDPDRIIYLTGDNSELVTPEKEVMDIFNITKLCCRNQMMSIVEL